MQIKKDAVGVSDVILSPDSLSVYYSTLPWCEFTCSDKYCMKEKTAALYLLSIFVLGGG